MLANSNLFDSDTYLWQLLETHPEAHVVLGWHGVHGLQGLERLTLSGLCELYPVDLHILLRDLYATRSAL